MSGASAGYHGPITHLSGTMTVPGVATEATLQTVSGTLSVISGTTAIISGSLAVATGTLAIISGTAAVISGSLSVATGTLAVISGTLSVISGTLDIVSGTLKDCSGTLSTISDKLSVVTGTLAIATGTLAIISGAQLVISTSIHQEDAVHYSGDGGVQILAVRRDTATSSYASADGDYASLNVDNEGYLYGRSKAYDTATAADKAYEVSPLDSHYNSFDFTNSTAVAGGVTTNYYVDMAGYNYINFHWTNLAGSNAKTMTVSASLRDDGTAPGSLATEDWWDVTAEWFMSGSFTAKCWLEKDVSTDVKWICVRVVTAAGGATDNTWTGYGRKKVNM